jgi:hypothetical protein
MTGTLRTWNRSSLFPMSSNHSSAQVTTSFPVLGLLGATLVVLKALGYVTWPWLWVLAPFWIPVALVLGLVLGLGIVFVIAAIIDSK